MLEKGMELFGEWAMAASKTGLLQIGMLLFVVGLFAMDLCDPLSRQFKRQMVANLAASWNTTKRRAFRRIRKIRGKARRIAWNVAFHAARTILAVDRVLTRIGLNLLAHEEWNRQQKEELRRMQQTKLQRRCQRKIEREKAFEDELVRFIHKK